MSSKQPMVKVSTTVYNDRSETKLMKPVLAIVKPVPKAHAKFLKEGESVRIFIKYDVRYHYTYLRYGEQKSGCIWQTGKWHKDYENLSAFWKGEMATEIKSAQIAQIEKQILENEKLGNSWTFNEWNGEITPKWKFYDIQIRELDDVEIESDQDFVGR